MSEGTPKGMFNFEPAPVVSDSETPKVIFLTLPTLYGSDPDQNIIDIFVRIPIPPKESPNIGKILKNFEPYSRSRLRTAMTTSHSSANPAESDSAWKDYKRWIDSKISKLKNFGYKISERNFRFGFVPLMEISKLRNARLCLPTAAIKEVTPEAEVDFGHPECVMEEVVAQPFVFEYHQIEVSQNQQLSRTSYGDIPDVLLKTIEEMKVENAIVKECLDMQEMMFQLILSRLPPPPPQNP